MIRQIISSLLLFAMKRLCPEHIPMAGTDPTYCARCWKIIE